MIGPFLLTLLSSEGRERERENSEREREEEREKESGLRYGLKIASSPVEGDAVQHSTIRSKRPTEVEFMIKTTEMRSISWQSLINFGHIIIRGENN